MKNGYTPIIIKMKIERYYEVLDIAYTTMNYKPFIKLVSDLAVESGKLLVSSIRLIVEM